jgi:hypothetical protein
MTLSRDRPEILTPPEHPPACCTQQTITIPPQIAAKTWQKHDYPSPQWRRSYRRRTAAERLNATIKDGATTSIARGWCRLMGLAPLTLWIACLLAVRNQRILTACNNPPARQRPPRRRRPATPHPQTTPHPPRPAHRRTITTRHATARNQQQAHPPAQPTRPHLPAGTEHARKAGPQQPVTPHRQDHRG